MNELGLFATLRTWLLDHPQLAALAVFWISWAESLVVVGIAIPGIMVLFVLGALIALGVLDFYPIWLAASAGAIAGDTLSYALGRRYRGALAHRWPLKYWPELLVRGEAMCRRYGLAGIVLGRFIGPLRPIVPVVAGMLGMTPRRFLPLMALAGIAWAPAYLLPGIVLGASLDVASAYTIRLGILLAAFAALAWLVYSAGKQLYDSLAARTPWMLKRTVAALRRHPRLGRYIGPLVMPARGDVLSIAMLGVLLIVVLTLVSVLLLHAVLPGTPDLDRWTAEAAGMLRNHAADYPLLIGVIGGAIPVLAAAAGGLLLWLLFAGRRLAALHWLVAAGGALLLAPALQALLRLSPRWPPGLEAWGRFPDLPLTFAAIVIGFFPVLLARDLPAARRKWLYLSAALIILTIAVARLYFQLASLSAVAAALLLATGWALIVGIGYRVRAGAWFPARGPIAVFGLLYFGALAVCGTLQGPATLAALTPAPQRIEMTQAAWLEDGWRRLPRQRSRIGGRTSETFDGQWAACGATLGGDLQRAGWQRHGRVGTARLLLEMLHPDPTPERLPLMRKDFQGRAADELFSRPLDRDRLIVLRLWDSGLRIDQRTPVWLVEATIEHITVRGWWFAVWTLATAPPAAIEASLRNVFPTARWAHPADGPWLLKTDESEPNSCINFARFH